MNVWRRLVPKVFFGRFTPSFSARHPPPRNPNALFLPCTPTLFRLRFGPRRPLEVVEAGPSLLYIMLTLRACDRLSQQSSRLGVYISPSLFFQLYTLLLERIPPPPELFRRHILQQQPSTGTDWYFCVLRPSKVRRQRLQ